MRTSSHRVVIAGGSGFVGTSLAEHLTSAGMHVVTLTRSATLTDEACVRWDGRTLGSWSQALDGADALINLCGRSVNCIKTPDHQDEILRSRIESTRVLGIALRRQQSPPPVWIQMSTAHIYGDPPEIQLAEDSPLGVGFAPSVGRAWEREFCEAALPRQRHVVLRTSFVVGKDRGRGNGALSQLNRVTRFGLGGRVGSGRQGFSWIHETDLNRIIERAILDRAMRGVYIASSPQPVPQAEFMKELRNALRVPLGLPAAPWMVRWGATYLLRSDPELTLYGRFVLPKRLLREGFEFRYPRLAEALAEVAA
ncbi:MAG: TIGR01777 family oxidoreductase [Planctomycetota bacterium]